MLPRHAAYDRQRRRAKCAIGRLNRPTRSWHPPRVSRGPDAGASRSDPAAKRETARRDRRAGKRRCHRVKLYHGWRLYAFEPFAERLRALKEEVERLRARDPKTTASPNDGATRHRIQRHHRARRVEPQSVRVPGGAQPRARQRCARRGAKTDVYAVFQRMLRRGEVPSNIEELKKNGSAIDV